MPMKTKKSPPGETEGGFGKWIGRGFIAILALQALLVFLSWALSALYPQWQLHSLISGEGLRWAFRHLYASATMPLLASIVVLTIAVGLLVGSRLLRPSASHPLPFRVIQVIRCTLILLLCVALCFVSLPALLTPTGRLLPMAVVNGVIPLLSVAIIVSSLVGGYIIGTFHSLADVVRVAVRSLAKAAPLLLFYILLAQLWAMLQYVF